MKCPTCGGETVQKNRVLLFAVGAVMLATPALAGVAAIFWAPAIVLFLAGIYLVVWSTLGRGRWCRNCKKFSLR
jgi:hypothetical protein